MYQRTKVPSYLIMKRLYTLLLLLFITAGTVSGQIAAWDFTGETALATSVAEVFNANLSGSNTMTRGAGASASSGSNSFRTTSFQNNGISTANTDYFQVTLSAAVGYTLSLSTIDARFAGTSTFRASPGVSAQFAYSLDGSNFTLIGSPFSMTANGAMPQIDLTAITALQDVDASTTITFRYYASGQTTTGGWGFNSPSASSYGLAIGGTLDVSAVEDPTITTSVSELSGFLYQEGAGPSTSQSFEVDGLALDPATGDVTVTGTSSFEVSSDDATFGATATISYAGGELVDELIYVRLKSGLTAGAYNNETIEISGGGIAQNVEVTVSGTVSEIIELPYLNDFRTEQNLTDATNLGFTLNGGTVWGGTASGGYTRITNAGNITSPIIDFSGSETVRVSVDLTTFGGNTGQVLSVDLSADGGDTYGNIAEFSVPGSYTTFTVEFAGAAYAQGRLVFLISAGTNEVRFRDLRIEEVIEASASLTGSAGWRLLSSPVSGSTYADLLGPIWTQGATGADATNGTPNVFWSEGSTTASLNATNVTNLNNTIPAGRGFAVLVFDDDDYTGPGGIVWPKTLSVTGTENAADVTYTPAWTSGTEYAIAGNPFASTIDWDNVTKGADVHNAVWVWNPATSTYDDYNGDNGNLTGGLIAPFQGFWVQYNGTDRGITFPSAAKSTGGSFRGKEETPRRMVVRASDSAGSNLAWVAFRDGATLGEDRYDAVKFTPLSSDYIQAFTIAADKAHGINVLPSDLTDALEIPFGVTSTRGGLVTLDLTELNLPEGWMVSIRDNVTNETRAMNADFNYTFEASRAKAAPASETPQVLAANDPRFTLIVDPLGTTSVDGNQKSEIGFALAQNYPNPFNPSTQIRFTLQSSDVTRLTVYDVVGRQVAVLVNGTMPAGSHSITFDASNLTSGVYIYKLEAGGQVITKRMTLLK